MPKAFLWETVKDWFENKLQIIVGNIKHLSNIYLSITSLNTHTHTHRGDELIDAFNLEVIFPPLFRLGWEDSDGSGATLAEWNQSHIWQPQRELLQSLSHSNILRKAMTNDSIGCSLPAHGRRCPKQRLIEKSSFCLSTCCKVAPNEVWSTGT